MVTEQEVECATRPHRGTLRTRVVVFGDSTVCNFILITASNYGEIIHPTGSTSSATLTAIFFSISTRTT